MAVRTGACMLTIRTMAYQCFEQRWAYYDNRGDHEQNEHDRDYGDDYDNHDHDHYHSDDYLRGIILSISTMVPIDPNHKN